MPGGCCANPQFRQPQPPSLRQQRLLCHPRDSISGPTPINGVWDVPKPIADLPCVETVTRWWGNAIPAPVVIGDCMAYRICTSCEIHHIENCGTCLGFGIKNTSELIPITAGEAHSGSTLGWSPCPECGSTPVGVPSEATKQTRHKPRPTGRWLYT